MSCSYLQPLSFLVRITDFLDRASIAWAPLPALSPATMFP